MGNLTLVLIMLPSIVAGGVCVYLAHRTIQTQDAIIQSYQQRNDSKEQILDELLTIIDEYLDHLSIEIDALNEHDDVFQYMVQYAAGVDSARAVIEFYFEKLALGEKADLKELLERGKVNDKAN